MKTGKQTIRDIRVATAQFENKDNDKEFNLGRVSELTRIAVEQNAEIVSFHECCIPAYTWLQPLGKQELLEVAEFVPDGPSVNRLFEIARDFSVVVMAGCSNATIMTTSTHLRRSQPRWVS